MFANSVGHDNTEPLLTPDQQDAAKHLSSEPQNLLPFTHAIDIDVSEAKEDKPDNEEKKEEAPGLNEIQLAINDNTIDEEFLGYLRSHKIKSIFESVASDVFTINSYLSILYFANAARRFPAIQKLVYDALKKVIYYVCTLHEEVIKAISLEAATVGTEATSFTSTYMVVGSALLVLLLTYQILKYPFAHSKKAAFKELLDEFGLDSRIWGRFFNISNTQLDELTHLIKSKISTEKELVQSLLSVYFEDLSGAKLKDFSAHVEKHQLKAKLVDNMVLKPSKWQRFVANSEWYQDEIARYRIPLAAICAIPGLVWMILKSLDIGGADITTLITDKGSVLDQANTESLEIYPWIAASFPVILFQSTAMFLFLATRVSMLNGLATGFYHKVHEPIEKWAKDAGRWVYYNLGQEIITIPAVPAITAYAGIRSFDFIERYASAVGCGSAGKVFKSIVTDTSDPSGKCSTATKANLVALLVGDSEFDKFYLFYSLLLVTYYPVITLIEKFSSLKEWLPKEKALQVYEEFKKINRRSFYIAGSVTFVAAWVAFFIAKRFADHIPEEGLQVAYDINDYIHSNMTMPEINNSTLPGIMHQLCPNANLSQIISDAIKNLPVPHNMTELEKVLSSLNFTGLDNATFPAIPVKIINNSTLVATLAAECPSYGVVMLFFLNLAGVVPDCNPLVEYRTLAAFVTLFWMAISLTGGGTFSLSSASQLLGWGVNTLKNWWCGEENVAEASHADANVPDSNPENSEEAKTNLSDESYVHVDSVDASQEDEKNETAREPLFPDENKKNYWSGCCNSIYHLFSRKVEQSVPVVVAAPEPPIYEPPSVRITII
jgi:hypothetical protein